MVPSGHARASRGRRPTLILLALAALLALGTAPAHGEDLSDRLAVARSAMRSLEGSMRYQDAVLSSLRYQRADAKRGLREAGRRAAQVRSWRSLLERRLAVARTQVQEAEAGGAAAPRWMRSRLGRLEVNARRLAALSVRIDRSRRALARRVASLNRQVRGAIGRSSYAGSLLASRIATTVPIAQARAAQVVDARPAIDSSRVTRPARGRISQRFGCTGFYLEPRRGSCAHFHDGLDIAGPYGSRVVAAAAGVVAYVGWSPQGAGDRAYIVVVGHPGGFQTLYGHLVPVQRVRTGQFVRAGQVVGLLGNTGRSTGPHLHFEVVRWSVPLDPRDFLARGDDPRDDSPPREEPPSEEPPGEEPPGEEPPQEETPADEPPQEGSQGSEPVDPARAEQTAEVTPAEAERHEETPPASPERKRSRRSKAATAPAELDTSALRSTHA